jgi:MOSC domain-containing protein YiiM
MPMLPVAEANALKDRGLEGDRATACRSKRQVTLIQFEHLDSIAMICGKDRVAPELLRRNIVVSGVDLLLLMKQLVSIGAAILEVRGYCAPCNRIEQALGSHGHEAMNGRGGVTGIVRRSGPIRLGDRVHSLGVPQQILPLN